MSPRILNELAVERARRGWSQAHVAKLGGITRQSYSAIESGEAVPSTEVALRLARAFGRGVEELFRLPESPAPRVVARAAEGVGSIGQRVRLARLGGAYVAYGLGEAERPMRAADGIVRGLGVAGEVEVSLLPDRPPEPALVVVGCDPAFGVVADSMLRDRGVEVAWSHRGSRAALEALGRGEAHVAGAHLRDVETGAYNERWIRDLVPFPCTRISFAVWEQGILLRAGNPLRVSGVEDLAQPRLRFLNREPGSGSRALLDERLRQAGLPESRISGYSSGARGHMALAEAIASGLADAGIGIRAAGRAYGLDVVSLEEERYELVVPDHFLDLPAVQALIDTLGQPGIRAQVEALGGYDGTSMGRPA